MPLCKISGQITESDADSDASPHQRRIILHYFHLYRHARVCVHACFQTSGSVFFFGKFNHQNPKTQITSARFPPSQSRTEINSPRGSSRGAGATRAAPVLLRDEAPALRHSSQHKYLCCASLRLRPGHLMLHLIRTSGGSSWDVLLMDYRFSLLPRRFTMHPVCSHQIFSALWLELMHRSPPAESSLLISERKLGIGLKKKTALLIKAGNLLPSHWI